MHTASIRWCMTCASSRTTGSHHAGRLGLGQVWLNGMEVTQFTYFQQVGVSIAGP
jgi:glycyl-tRNA synthetase alpha subunit